MTLLVLAASMLVLVTGTFASCLWTASRLRRLYERGQAADAALRAHLRHRSSVALELARLGAVDPEAARDLVDAATRARDASDVAVWSAESELTRALDAMTPLVGDTERLVEVLRATQRRASVARRIHNDAVGLAAALQRRRRVRWLTPVPAPHLAAMIEFDDGTR